MTQLSKEQKQILIDTANHVINRDNTSAYSENLRELARIALAALTAEPVMYAMIKGGEFDPELVSDCDYVVDAWVDEHNELHGGLQYRIAPLCAAPQPVAVPDESYQHLSELYHAQEKRLFKLAQRIKGPAFDKYAYSTSQAIDVLEVALFGEDEEACRAAMLQPSSGALQLPDGWKLVPVEPTAEMISSGISAHYERSQIQIHDRPAPGPMECAYVAMLNAAPVNPEFTTQWIPCSERMPEVGDVVLTAKDGYVNVGEMERSGAHCRYFTSVASGRELPADYWMPLPTAPQEPTK